MTITRRVALALTLLCSPVAWADPDGAPAAASQPSEQPAGVAPATEATPAPKAKHERIPDWRFTINNLLVARYNPIGLEDQIRMGVQRKLYDNGKALFENNFFFFGLAPKINPAYLKLGPSLEIQPLSIFNLHVGVEMIQYFSTFGYLQSFQTPTAVYDDSTNTKAEKYGKNYSTTGLHVMIEPLIQLKFGPVAVRNKFSAEYWSMRTHAGDPANPSRTDTVFYDPTLDTLVPSRGWVIANDLDAIYLRAMNKSGQLALGVRYTMVRPFYSKSDLLPGETMGKINNGHHRLGPLVAYTFYDEPYSAFNKPTVLLIMNWYVQHRWRTGQDMNQGIPYIVLGFAFESDLMK